MARQTETRALLEWYVKCICVSEQLAVTRHSVRAKITRELAFMVKEPTDYTVP